MSGARDEASCSGTSSWGGCFLERALREASRLLRRGQDPDADGRKAPPWPRGASRGNLAYLEKRGKVVKTALDAWPGGRSPDERTGAQRVADALPLLDQPQGGFRSRSLSQRPIGAYAP